MAFHVGMKVTPIPGMLPWTFPDGSPSTIPAPVVGEVYIIRAINIGVFYSVVLQFDEFQNAAWASDCFRPVVDRKTDISIFTAMLTQKKVKEPTHV